MKRILALLVVLCLLPLYGFAQITPDEGSVHYALIVSEKLTNRLNLRKSPSSDSETLGRFYNGTVVEVIERGEAWSYVCVGYRLWGYMMNEYLVPFCERESFLLGHEMSGQEQEVFKAVMESGASFYDSMNTGDELRRVSDHEQVTVLGDINDDWLLVQRSDSFISSYVRRQDIRERYTQGLAVVVSSKEGNTITLRADAKDSAPAIGKYRAGTAVSVLDTKNGYARVAIIGEGQDYSVYDPQEQSGFAEGWMKVDYLRWGCRADWIGTRNVLAVGQVKEREAVVYDGEYRPAGVLAKGMRMLVLSLANDKGFLHVDTGMADPVFIRETDVEILKDVHTPGDLPVMGYGAIKGMQGAGESENFVLLHPFCEKVDVYEDLPAGFMVSVLSVGDDWVQVRRRGTEGYVPRENVELFLKEDCKGNAMAAAGTYHAGTEYFKSGLYTFTGDPGDEMTVTYADGNVRTFGPDGGSYTLQLQAGDTVTLSGGLLAPMEWGKLFLDARHDTYSGSGRYFCGEHFYGNNYWDYEIQPLDPNKEAWYEICTLEYEMGGEGYCTRVSLSEDQGEFDAIDSLQILGLTPGEILEFHNCIIRIHYGNG